METSNTLFHPPVILSIAGSDSFAGAGIQADIKTAGALGAYCCTAITAVTAQNSKTVRSVWPVPTQGLLDQIKAVMEDVDVKAIKVGMLGSVEAVEVVREILTSHGHIPVVLDPVIRSSSGDALASDDIVDAIRDRLFPLATVITPNLDEAAAILAIPLATGVDGMREQALALQKQGARAVLLKGGHLRSSLVIDVLAGRDGIEFFEATQIITRHTHGTGCSLSTAIAVELAKGISLNEAVRVAKAYVTSALAGAAAGNIVENNGPLNHFYYQNSGSLIS